MAQVLLVIFSGALARAKRSLAEHHGCVNLLITENSVITWPYNRANDRLSAPQEKPMFTHTFKLVWERRKKLIAHQCCDQMTAVKTGHPLTSITWPYRGLRCRPIEVEYFLKLSADNSLVFKWSQAHVYFFLNSYQICCVYVSIAPHYYDFDFKLTSDAKIQPVFLKYRRGRPFLTMVTCWSRSTSNFYALIG